MQIAILGLGQIGTSIGLSLKPYHDKLQRVGHDIDLSVAKKAKAMGAIDKVFFNVPSMVKKSDLVLLTIPFHQIEPTLRLIAPDLKMDAVVMDTAPGKFETARLAESILPGGRYYVGLIPVINPKYLDLRITGIEAARDDLFKDGLFAIASPSNTVSDAIKLAADFSQLVGATPLFSDSVEIDGIRATTDLLPQLLGTALLNTTTGSSGWRESTRLTCRSYAMSAWPLAMAGNSASLADLSLAQKENIVRSMDLFIQNLNELRNAISGDEHKQLVHLFEKALTGLREWEEHRKKVGDAPEGLKKVEMPTLKGEFSRLLFGGRVRREVKDDR